MKQRPLILSNKREYKFITKILKKKKMNNFFYYILDFNKYCILQMN